MAEAGASFQGHEFVRDKALEFLGALEGSDLSRFRLFILFLLLLCCVLCGSLLLTLILVPLTTFVSHCMSPLFADAHELDCPAVDGSVLQPPWSTPPHFVDEGGHVVVPEAVTDGQGHELSRREPRSFYGQAVNVSIRRADVRSAGEAVLEPWKTEDEANGCAASAREAGSVLPPHKTD